jgi:hypothetical protein
MHNLVNKAGTNDMLIGKKPNHFQVLPEGKMDNIGP